MLNIFEKCVIHTCKIIFATFMRYECSLVFKFTEQTNIEIVNAG